MHEYDFPGSRWPVQVHDGYRYLTVVIDYLTKYTIAYPSKSIAVEEASRQFMKNIVSKYGISTYLASDNSSAFRSKVFQTLCQTYGIVNAFVTVLTPHSQGLVERTNASVLSALHSYIDENQGNWPHYVHSASFMLNTAENEATSYCPFYLMFGRPPVGQSQVKIAQDTNVPMQNHGTLQEIMSGLNDAHTIAPQNILDSQQSMTRQYGQRASDHPFRVGNIVYLNDPPPPHTHNINSPLWKKMQNGLTVPARLSATMSS